MLERIGWGALVEDVFYRNSAAVIEKYKLIPK